MGEWETGREGKGKGITSANRCVELIQLRTLVAQSQGPVSHRSVKDCDPRNSTVAPGVLENGNTHTAQLVSFLLNGG